MHLKTRRLTLIPATAALVRAEIEDRAAFFRMLGVQPVEDWPPAELVDVLPFFLEQLKKDTGLVGWLSWYWVRYDGGKGELVGNGGFTGKPVDAQAEVGYMVREAHRRQGYATEAVQALVDWAFEAGVETVWAETAVGNVASRRVLEKLGFVEEGEGTEPGMVRLIKRAR